MNKAILMLLAAMSTGAMAEWVALSESDSRVLYIDPPTIRKDGHFRKVWDVQDLKQRGKDGEMSRRTLIEYDCKEEQFRILSASIHSGPMSRGETLASGSYTGDWSPVVPNSLAATVLKVACGKVKLN